MTSEVHNSYHGQIKDGLFHGKGVLVYSTKEKYEVSSTRIKCNRENSNLERDTVPVRFSTQTDRPTRENGKTM